jgi:hypothetical protein
MLPNCADNATVGLSLLIWRRTALLAPSLDGLLRAQGKPGAWKREKKKKKKGGNEAAPFIPRDGLTNPGETWGMPTIRLFHVIQSQVNEGEANHHPQKQ